MPRKLPTHAKKSVIEEARRNELLQKDDWDLNTEELLLKYRDYAYHYAHGWFRLHPKLSYDELHAEALYGMYVASQKYDRERLGEHTGERIKFSSVATHWMMNAIQAYVKRETRRFTTVVPHIVPEGEDGKPVRKTNTFRFSEIDSFYPSKVSSSESFDSRNFDVASPDNDEEIGHQYEEMERAKQVWDLAKERLPERSVQILRLKFFEGQSHRGIARIVRLSTTRVSQIVERSMELLKSALQEV